MHLDQRPAIRRREAANPTLVPFHDLGTDEKAETCPGNLADRACPESPLENMRSSLRRNTDSVIANRYARLGRRRA